MSSGTTSCFPCILIALSSKRSAAYRLSAAAAAVAILILTGPGYMMGFAVWMMGAALTLVPSQVISTRARWWTVAVYAPLFLLSGQDAKLAPNSAVIPLGVLTTMLLWMLLGAKQRANQALWVRGSRMLSGFSYTLYLVHVPILTFIAGSLVGDDRWMPSVGSLFAAGASFLVTLTIAFAISLGTEARTPQIRNWLLSQRAAK